ncbi:hypothetical protein PPERSA_05149 [Pseudocohnilembus persalinus]|uniref:Uncharacterized protein n=1 Tax=Pseudocohnilembus persalinus TaxID=266149 RepID=A0A0V0QX75_PSEPJ|nr:hypothetical protein PPERSA_05149 [Pseudocohnilembus persalinus]|eukprot:KRX06536.1 hypothetical protein PPERSA_05149 [Pseudocohnilembus persalinus]
MKYQNLQNDIFPEQIVRDKIKRIRKLFKLEDIQVIQEKYDKMTEGEMSGGLYFLDKKTDTVNGLNPISLGISYFNYKYVQAKIMTQTKKHQNQTIVKNIDQRELPKISYIHLGQKPDNYSKEIFDFYHSQTEPLEYIDLQNPNIQFIQIYDKKQENIEKKFKLQRDKIQKQIDIPIDIDRICQYQQQQQGKQNEKPEKIVKSSEFLYIFERLVFPLLQEYNPSLIVFSYNFEFTNSHSNQFLIQPDLLGYIIAKFQAITHHKVLMVCSVEQDLQLKEDQLYQEFIKSYLQKPLNKSINIQHLNIKYMDEMIKNSKIKSPYPVFQKDFNSNLQQQITAVIAALQGAKNFSKDIEVEESKKDVQKNSLQFLIKAIKTYISILLQQNLHCQYNLNIKNYHKNMIAHQNLPFTQEKQIQNLLKKFENFYLRNSIFDLENNTERFLNIIGNGDSHWDGTQFYFQEFSQYLVYYTSQHKNQIPVQNSTNNKNNDKNNNKNNCKNNNHFIVFFNVLRNNQLKHFVLESVQKEDNVFFYIQHELKCQNCQKKFENFENFSQDCENCRNSYAFDSGIACTDGNIYKFYGRTFQGDQSTILENYSDQSQYNLCEEIFQINLETKLINNIIPLNKDKQIVIKNVVKNQLEDKNQDLNQHARFNFSVASYYDAQIERYYLILYGGKSVVKRSKCQPILQLF